MPQSKKQRLMEGGSNAVIRSGGSSVTDTHLDDLSADVIEHILGCLGPVDIMRARCCKKWREAAKKTIVPMADFLVNSVEKYNAMAAMATALPNLQKLTLSRPGSENKYNDGEDPYTWVRHEDSSDEEDASYDIEIISNFRKLRSLCLSCTGLNGRYPGLFNNFQLLEQLTIDSCGDLKVNLEILGGLSSLKELSCQHDYELVGNINSLRVLKDQLEKVVIRSCGTNTVEGQLMDLADFPRLRKLDLSFTAVTGDVRDVGDHDFPNLEQLDCSSGVVGGRGHEFQHVSDVPSVIDAYQRLKERRASLFTQDGNMRYWRLSKESPDWYEGEDDLRFPRPPFMIKFVKAGSRFGWRWCWCDRKTGDYSCEVNWLDSEPGRESSDYDDYIVGIQDIERAINFYFYEGHHQLPTEEEYRRLCLEYNVEES
eukprot:scaffold33624_cov191-Skeletonema_dohrnii-CCMP3373.AAC.2